MQDLLSELLMAEPVIILNFEGVNISGGIYLLPSLAMVVITVLRAVNKSLYILACL